MRRRWFMVLLWAGLVAGSFFTAATFAQEEDAGERERLELEKTVVDFWEKLQPWVLEEYRNIQDFERKHELLRHLADKMRHLEELKEYMPEAYDRAVQRLKLEREARAAGRAYRLAQTQEEKAAAEKDCREAVAKLLKLRIEDTEKEVAELEERLSVLEKKLQIWKDKEDLLVENKVLQFTTGAEGLFDF